jgi:hypothetical protein
MRIAPGRNWAHLVWWPLLYLNSYAAGIEQVCTMKHALAVTAKPLKFSPQIRFIRITKGVGF